jgi:Uma2 family endonuclease
MTASPHRPLMSVEEYFQLDRNSIDTRYEYIDGHVRMLAGGTLNHATISLNLASMLLSLLRSSPCRVYNADARVRLSEARYVYPDVSVSCDERDRGEIDLLRYPQVIVEILSPSTEAYDRGEKFVYYRKCPAIQEYVLVNTRYPSIEVFRRAKNTFWTYHAFEPGEDVELASIGVRFPVADVYENVVFPLDDGDE